MKVAMVQIETLVGDFDRNCKKICDFITKAKQEECDIVVFPELCLVGYHPMDLLNKAGFCEKASEFVKVLKQHSQGIVSIFGSVCKKEGKLLNSAFVTDGKICFISSKTHITNFPPLYEGLYFTPSDKDNSFIKVKNRRILVMVGDDFFKLSDIDADVVVNIGLVPYREGKICELKDLLVSKAKELNVYVVWVNGVGEVLGNVFFGNSMIVTPRGLVFETKPFEEKFEIVNLDDCDPVNFENTSLRWEEEVVGALTFGFRSYFRKSGLERAVIGLSGGMDSSISACLAKLAIGSEKLVGISMPGPFSSKESVEDAKELAGRLGIEFHVISITSIYERFLELFKDLFKGRAPDVTEENLQARLRAVILMTYSNKFNALVINTGNKSEAAVGYSTLYGDSVGGISLVGDLYKTSVYKIARYINDEYRWIPDRIFSKPPSAELRLDQKDEDDIPPYEILDSILKMFLDENLSKIDVVKKGFDRILVEEVFKRFQHNEYKRKQSPFCIKISSSNFKRDMLPLVFKVLF